MLFTRAYATFNLLHLSILFGYLSCVHLYYFRAASSFQPLCKISQQCRSRVCKKSDNKTFHRHFSIQTVSNNQDIISFKQKEQSNFSLVRRLSPLSAPYTPKFYPRPSIRSEVIITPSTASPHPQESCIKSAVLDQSTDLV